MSVALNRDIRIGLINIGVAFDVNGSWWFARGLLVPKLLDSACQIRKRIIFA
jgi:hypothetical protein